MHTVSMMDFPRQIIFQKNLDIYEAVASALCFRTGHSRSKDLLMQEQLTCKLLRTSSPRYIHIFGLA